MGAGMREVVVHLNVVVPGSDGRPVDEVVDALLAALAEGARSSCVDGDGVYDVRGLFVTCPLAEEV